MENTLPKAARIVNSLDGAGYRVLVGHQRRHNPLVLEARTIEHGSARGQSIEFSML